MTRVWIMGVLAILAMAGAAGAQPPSRSTTELEQSAPAEPCTLKPAGTFAVTRTVGADVIVLEDGSEVRLAGLLPPHPPVFVHAGANWAPETNAAQALGALLTGQHVELAYAERKSDRWGRLVAHVFHIDHRGVREWVQGALLRDGHARVDARPQDLTCLPEMLAHERVGMTADAGLWANPAYRIRWADAPERLMRLRNTFQLVEGIVKKVAVTKSRIFVNFGTDWRSDFTAAAALRSTEFPETVRVKLQALEGKRVRVRGWIERRNGPYIELFHPAQIEPLQDQDLPPSAGIARSPAPRDAGSDPAQIAPPPDNGKRPAGEAIDL